MEDLENKESEDSGATGFRSFAAKRIIVGILLAVVGLWIVGMIFGFFPKPTHTNIKVVKTDHEIVKTDTHEYAGNADAVHKTIAKKSVVGDYGHQKPDVTIKTHKKAVEESRTKHIAIEPIEDKVVGVTFVKALIKPLDY